MKHSAIFDLDGTLWNTVAACTIAWNQVLESEGEAKRLTEKDVAGCMGLVSEQIRERLLGDLPAARAQAIVERCFGAELLEITRAGKGLLYPGVSEGLTHLRESHGLFLVSNCDPDYLETFFSITGLAAHFQDWECHGRTGLTKGENLKLVVQRNHLTEMVFIGDTESDEAAAKLASVPFVFARYGFGQVKDYTHAVDSFSELVSWLRRG